MYLSQHAIGPHSGILNGMHGIEVDVIRENGKVTLVQDKEGNRFWAPTEFLTEEKPVIDENEVKEILVRGKKSKQGGLFK